MQIYSSSNKNGLTFTKSFDSNSIPSVGAKIQDPIFVEDKTITSIVIDYSADTCCVFLEGKEVPNDRLSGHIQEVATLHEWVLSKKESVE